MKYYLIFAFLLISFVSKSQNYAAIADSLYEQGNYEKSLLHYEFILFNADENKNNTDILIKKSKCYQNLHDYPSAIRTLSRITNPPVVMQYEITYQMLLNHYLLNDSETAFMYFNQIRNDYPDQMFTFPVFYVHCMLLAEQDQNDSLQNIIYQYHTLNRIQPDSSFIQALLKKKKKEKQVRTAQILSMIIPGLGQIYGSEYMDGSVSFILNAATITYAIYCLKGNMYINAVVSGFGLFKSFYLGGIQHSRFIILKQNDDRKNTYRTEVNQYIYSLNRKKAE